MQTLTRRRLILAGATAALWPSLGAVRAASFDRDPFTLGVASGCPTPFGVILWTRLTFPAPPPPADPFAPLPEVHQPPVELFWEVAEDEGFAQVVQAGLYRAVQAYGHSVHVAVTGLRPDRRYFYRFRAGDALSPVGRTRTAPTADSRAPLRFAFASCQQFEQGHYAAYRDMAARDPDLVVHLGDYIYERSWGANHVRSHGGPWPVRLQEYRDRYALYKSDPDLQAAHRTAPWLVTWDDHEVINNYADDHAPDGGDRAAFLRQRAAAYQAWYEHMPVPPHMGGDFAHFRIHGLHGRGALVDIALLDIRQYRAHPLRPGQADGTDRSMLGRDQEVWLDATLRDSRARWSVVAQQTLLSERDLAEGAATRYSTDGWDGYRQARDRLLRAVQGGGAENTLVIGGDLHAFYAAEVKQDFTRPDSTTLATEFVTGAISSDPPAQTSVDLALRENPHLKYGSARQHGYALMTLTDRDARCDFIAVSDRKDPDATARIHRSFAVLPGAPGVNKL